MRVIEERREDQWVKQVKCNGNGNELNGVPCGSTLEIDESDLFHTRFYGMGESRECVTFKCMVCGQLNDMEENEVPSGIRRRILSKPAVKP